MKEITLRELSGNPVKRFAEDWALITAGTEEGFNTMTASWGGVGELWGKDVAFVFLRPQRYTKEFVDANDRFTISFYGPEWKKALSLCGAKSGRDIDKAKETGLTPAFIGNTAYFKEAGTVLVCRKMAVQKMEPSAFLDPDIDSKWYPEKDYHTMYVGEVEKVLIQE